MRFHHWPFPISTTLHIPVDFTPHHHSPQQYLIGYKLAIVHGCVSAYQDQVSSIVHPLLGKMYNSPEQLNCEIVTVSQQLVLLHVAFTTLPTHKTSKGTKKWFKDEELSCLAACKKAVWDRWSLMDIHMKACFTKRKSILAVSFGEGWSFVLPRLREIRSNTSTICSNRNHPIVLRHLSPPVMELHCGWVVLWLLTWILYWVVLWRLTWILYYMFGRSISGPLVVGVSLVSRSEVKITYADNMQKKFNKAMSMLDSALHQIWTNTDNMSQLKNDIQTLKTKHNYDRNVTWEVCRLKWIFSSGCLLRVVAISGKVYIFFLTRH